MDKTVFLRGYREYTDRRGVPCVCAVVSFPALPGSSGDDFERVFLERSRCPEQLELDKQYIWSCRRFRDSAGKWLSFDHSLS